MNGETSGNELSKTPGYGPKGGSLPGQQKALRHGLNPLKKAVYKLGNRALDKRTLAGRALVQWRQDLIRDLGGDVSTQQDAIVSLAVKTKLLLDSVDVWLLQQDTLIIKRKRAIIPAVQQRQVLADALARYMSMLGLERRTKLPSLHEILAKDDDKPGTGNGTADEQPWAMRVTGVLLRVEAR
jgi:hypothetical protein